MNEGGFDAVRENVEFPFSRNCVQITSLMTILVGQSRMLTLNIESESSRIDEPSNVLREIFCWTSLTHF
jgi:hypothetical protein